MCGIVGMYSYHPSGVSEYEIATFIQLLYVDALRGMHGTGMFGVEKNGGSYRVKVGGPPHQLFGDKKFDDMMKWLKKKNTRAIVGHNRFATRGEKTTAHAHPFHHGEDGNAITLVHNGTLTAFQHLPDGKKFDVDSEAICHSIQKIGVKDTMAQLRGAWALVYWDEKNKSLNLLRNKERPLWVARHDGMKVLTFASEPGALRWILDRNVQTLAKIEPVPENQLVTFYLDEESEKPHLTECKGAADVVVKCDDVPMDGYYVSGELVGGKNGVEESHTKGNEPPPKKYKQSAWKDASNSTGNQGGGAVVPFAKRPYASIPPPSKGRAPNYIDNAGTWVRADSLHDLGRGKLVNIQIVDWVDIPDHTERYQMRCVTDAYPDIEFFCNLEGSENLEGLMKADLGIRAVIRSILKSQTHVSKFPHKIFVGNPEPVYSGTPQQPE